jgi:hypothetical protein
VLAIETFVL